MQELNFTPHAQQALALARWEADHYDNDFIRTEHLLLGMLRLGQGTAAKALNKMGLQLKNVRAEIDERFRTGLDEQPEGKAPLSPRVKTVFRLAAEEAQALAHSNIGTEHLLLGLLREGHCVAARVLNRLGVNTETARETILKERDPNYSFRPEQREPNSPPP